MDLVRGQLAVGVLKIIELEYKSAKRKSYPKQVKSSVSDSHAASLASSTSQSLNLPPSEIFVEPPNTKVATSTQEIVAPAENRQVFYKGGLMHCRRSAEGPNKKIFPSLTSTPPGDFHAINGG